MITIAADAGGEEAARPFVEAAKQTHPTLVDRELRIAELYDVRNVPAVFWIDEDDRFVRAGDPIYAQQRNRETNEVTVNTAYLEAVKDWVAKGPESQYLMDSARLANRRPELDEDDVQAAAEFQLGRYLATHGHEQEAIAHFKQAHALRPENWTYKRQAWKLGDAERDYGTTVIEAIRDPNAPPFYPPLDLTPEV